MAENENKQSGRKKFSRRDFIKAAGIIAGSAALAACTPTEASAPVNPQEVREQQERNNYTTSFSWLDKSDERLIDLAKDKNLPIEQVSGFRVVVNNVEANTTGTLSIDFTTFRDSSGRIYSGVHSNSFPAGEVGLVTQNLYDEEGKIEFIEQGYYNENAQFVRILRQDADASIKLLNGISTTIEVYPPEYELNQLINLADDEPLFVVVNPNFTNQEVPDFLKTPSAIELNPDQRGELLSVCEDCEGASIDNSIAIKMGDFTFIFWKNDFGQFEGRKVGPNNEVIKIFGTLTENEAVVWAQESKEGSGNFDIALEYPKPLGNEALIMAVVSTDGTKQYYQAPENTEIHTTFKNAILTEFEKPYISELFEDSIVIPVEGEYGGLPVKVNILSHKSVEEFQFSDITHVDLKENKGNRYGETGENAIAHAIFQALAQANGENTTAQSLVSLIKENPNLEIPIFASNLDNFATNGYKPEETTFRLYNPETGEPNQINLVFMNVPSNKFPGDHQKVLTFPDLGIGLFVDNAGNLYAFINSYANNVAYSKHGSGLATTIQATRLIESISWQNGIVNYEDYVKINKMQTEIFKILTSDNTNNGTVLKASQSQATE